MDIVLRRNAPVLALEVLLTIGRAEPRKDVIAVLKEAIELGGQITAEDVCQKLLVDRPISFGMAVVRRCQTLGVLDSKGEITQEGKEAVQRGTIFKPELGQYLVRATTDQLIPDRILALQPVSPASPGSVVRSRNGSAVKSKTPPDLTLEKTPPWMLELVGREITLARKGDRIKILKVESQCKDRSAAQEERVQFEWRLPAEGSPSLQLRGFVEAQVDPPPITHEAAFHQVLGKKASNWKSEMKAFAIAFDETNDNERSSRRTEIQAEAPKIEGYGQFEATTIPNVPLTPKGNKSAQAWAVWLLEREITEHTGPRRYSGSVKALKRSFVGYEIDLPNVAEFATEMGKRRDPKTGRFPAAYWFLQAPNDLRFEEALQ